MDGVFFIGLYSSKVILARDSRPPRLGEIRHNTGEVIYFFNTLSDTDTVRITRPGFDEGLQVGAGDVEADEMRVGLKQ